MRSDVARRLFNSSGFVSKLGGFFHRVLSCLVLPPFLTACSKESSTGPAEVRWDREICVRCAMSVGDRRYTGQVRGGEQGQKPQVYKLDDIGCADVWVQDRPWKDNSATEIWVNDFTDVDRLDAKTANFVKGRATPMDYALGARNQGGPDALNFEQARLHILEVDNCYQVSTSRKCPVNARRSSARKQLWLTARTDISESLQARWFMVYTLVFGGVTVGLFLTGLTESRIMGFTGLPRLLVTYLSLSMAILPLFVLISAVRSMAGDREADIFAYMLSLSVSLSAWYRGKITGRFTIVFFQCFLLCCWP